MTIVLLVPFGPSPAEMKRGTTVGRAVLPDTAVAVVEGLGERTVDSKLFLYRSTFCYFRASMLVLSH